MTILNFLLIAAGLYSAIAVGYQLLMWYVGKSYKAPCDKKQHSNQSLRFMMLIPAYKEDKVILKTVINLMQLSYPSKQFSIMVVADGLQYDTLQSLYALNIEVVEVKFEKSTKVKALQAAIRSMKNNFDYVVLLDADNQVDTHFLQKLNQKLDISKHEAVQVCRATKSTEVGVAFWDAFSEYCNNRLSAEGPAALGLSCKFAGSGMILKAGVFVNTIMRMNSISGFDKDMETRLTYFGKHIYYFGDLCVYDEKVNDHRQLSKQRGRWIYAQYEYLLKNVRRLPSAARAGNLDYIHRVLHLALPPRFMFVTYLTLSLFLAIFIYPKFILVYFILLLLYSLIYIDLLISFSGGVAKIFKELASLIQVAKGYFGAFYYIPRAAKQFLHTSHQSN